MPPKRNMKVANLTFSQARAPMHTPSLNEALNTSRRTAHRPLCTFIHYSPLYLLAERWLVKQPRDVAVVSRQGGSSGQDISNFADGFQNVAGKIVHPID